MPEIVNTHARKIVELGNKMGERTPIDFDSIEPVEAAKTDWNIDEGLIGIQTACGALLFPFLMIGALFGFSLYSTNRD